MVTVTVTVTVADVRRIARTLPRTTEHLRYSWVCELVVEAWRMCVPKKVPVAYDAARRRR